jgi:hypothetical protein
MIKKNQHKTKGMDLRKTLLLIIMLFSFALSAPMDLSRSDILISSNIKSPVRESVIDILQEEVARRTALEWRHAEQWNDSGPTLAIVLSKDKELAGRTVPLGEGEELPENRPEGYRIVTQSDVTPPVIWIVGADDRATVYGVGHLLRHVNMSVNSVVLNQALDIATAPEQSVRGHQLGYRNTANSYDAWDVEQYDQYIRELALFGTNAVENIPFGKGNDSELMPISRQEMNIEISKICQAYDLDYWVWTPATFDLRETEKRQAMLDTHEQFYKSTPKLDHIFFPGGDPGHNHPRLVMPFLKDLYERLVKYHPEAGIWISLQGFSAEQIDYFYTYLEAHEPDWLMGVVSGPSSPPVADTRHRLADKYRHRHYPDITHNVRCDYPALNFDQAYALTIGREGINPQPNYYAQIHGTYAPFTDGFVAYSDGCHDDVNKVVWSMRGWDLQKPVREIMTEYCRFFFGPDLAESAADGIFALEQNWIGPIRQNGAIEMTLDFWQDLEKENPQLSNNWRWQMLVLRAYYDTYQRRRKIYETGLETQANNMLAQAQTMGAEKAMTMALDIVNKADTAPVARDLRAQIVHYCDELFRSCGLQTSVEKYQASSAQRGCILDFVDHPLNNRWWLQDEFANIRQMKNEEEKLSRLEVIRTWKNPGKGSYYDNVSDIETGPRVLTTSYDATDVAWWDDGFSRKRLSSQLFQTDPVLEYENLDFKGRYLLRVSGYGDALVRVDGERLEPIKYEKDIGEFKEFVIPKHITRDGKMRLTFDQPEESHLNWRDYSHVSDVWLIKR